MCCSLSVIYVSGVDVHKFLRKPLLYVLYVIYCGVYVIVKPHTEYKKEYIQL